MLRHFALSSERQSALSMHAPLALCEVPSTFAELIVFERIERNPTLADTAFRFEPPPGADVIGTPVR